MQKIYAFVCLRMRSYAKYADIDIDTDIDIDKETGEIGILEIKTTNILQSMQKEKWKEQIPPNYFCQVLHYMNVTGYSFVILKAQLKYDYDGDIKLDTRHYTIRREDVEDSIKELEKREIEFWSKYVEKDVRPPLELPNF